MSRRLSSKGGIEHIGVVVPAHNEQRLLPACLAALRYAADGLEIPVHILVVADTCTDQTVDVARAGHAQVLSISARNVGMARAAGMRELLRQMPGTDPAAIWLVTTDADSLVPGSDASSPTRTRGGTSSSALSR